MVEVPDFRPKQKFGAVKDVFGDLNPQSLNYVVFKSPRFRPVFNLLTTTNIYHFFIELAINNKS